ncbi:serine protease inhibitor 2-like [Anopheles cruzii]|uniref:serine protease inhibitor 2-like n=1 Tax=Anopheles cruzii TaxID=68878 RepID=UPI0022EC7445|nr:serine protease inhibitor 2-like [Anopheles cruzii]
MARPATCPMYALLLPLLLVSICTAGAATQEATLRDAAMHDFDWKLVREVFRHEDSNVVFSPFSLKLLMTLLYEASEVGSQTRHELEAVLGERNLNQTRDFYGQFLEASTKTNGDYDFDIGTRVFLDKSHGKLNPQYRELLERTYRTSLERLSFNETRVAADRINQWCEKVTQGHIRDLVKEDTIHGSMLILANVLFLKASWKNSFLDEHTHDREFHIGPNASVAVQFMHQTDLYDYTDHAELRAQVLRLPYKGRQFSMNMVLPHPNVSLATVAASLSSKMLDSVAKRFVREEVTVIIPKFKFNFGTLMNEAMQSLGIRDIFSRNASLPMLSSFSNSSKTGDLEVSKILQKVGIEINEKGTLAFAATEIQLVNKFGYDGDPFIFEANRPFVFYILDEETNTILFVGQVLDPSQRTAT